MKVHGKQRGLFSFFKGICAIGVIALVSSNVSASNQKVPDPNFPGGYIWYLDTDTSLSSGDLSQSVVVIIANNITVTLGTIYGSYPNARTGIALNGVENVTVNAAGLTHLDFGIFIYECTNVTINNFNSLYNNYGVVVAYSNGTRLMGTNSVLWSEYHGIYLEGAIATQLINSHSDRNGQYGFADVNGIGTVMTGCEASMNTYDGSILVQVAMPWIENFEATRNVANGMTFYDNTNGGRITDSHFNYNSAVGLYIYNSYGNGFYDCGGTGNAQNLYDNGSNYYENCSF